MVQDSDQSGKPKGSDVTGESSFCMAASKFNDSPALDLLHFI